MKTMTFYELDRFDWRSRRLLRRCCDPGPCGIEAMYRRAMQRGDLPEWPGLVRAVEQHRRDHPSFN